MFIVLENETVLVVYANNSQQEKKKGYFIDKEFFVAVLVYDGEIMENCTIRHADNYSFAGELERDGEILGVSRFFTIWNDGRIAFSPDFFNETVDFIFTGDLDQLHPNQLVHR